MAAMPPTPQAPYYRRWVGVVLLVCAAFFLLAPSVLALPALVPPDFSNVLDKVVGVLMMVTGVFFLLEDLIRLMKK